MADLTHLDSDALKKFNDNDVVNFGTDLTNIRKDDSNGVVSLHNLVGHDSDSGPDVNPVLAIGKMASSDTFDGQTLISAITKGAGSIDDVFTTNKTLFDDIHTDLGTVISTLLKTQGSSLDSIDGQKFLDPFTDVDGDLGGGSSSSSGS